MNSSRIWGGNLSARGARTKARPWMLGTRSAIRGDASFIDTVRSWRPLAELARFLQDYEACWRGGHSMAKITIKCASTGQVVPTGMATDEATWEKLSVD